MSRPALALGLALLAVLAGAAAAPAADARTVWLCHPRLADDPCRPGLATTRVSPAGQVLGTERPRRARRPAFDCFYVYPTVSDQRRPVARRLREPSVRSIARFQAARYSSDCRVFAPVYRQLTLSGLFNPGTLPEGAAGLGYRDVRAAWREYLRRHDRGRGVVFVSHSQGTFVLRRLLREEVDPDRAARRRLISGLLLGGNVLVARGRDAGGDFRRIRACRAPRQVGCVVAFSTYDQGPPAGALFGRAAVQLPIAPRVEGDTEVLCTNPAALRGGSGRITPVYPSVPFAPGTIIGSQTLGIGFPVPAVRTPWVASPDAYDARCTSEPAQVLLVTPRDGAPDLRELPTPEWGLHLADANVALGDLVGLVRRQAAAWRAREER